LPTLHVHLSRTLDQTERRMLVRRLTDAVCEAIGKKPEDVTIYLYVHGGGAQEMAYAGVLASDRNQAREREARPDRQVQGEVTG
jgi:tautomerase-like protein